MGNINAVLDEYVDYGFEGGPEYSNEVVDLENGFEHVDSAWAYARHRFSASFGNIKEDARDYIISVFHACRGRRHAFKFKDHNNYKAVAEPLVVFPGTMNPVQLYVTYQPVDPVTGEVWPAYTVRPIQAVKAGAVIKTPGGATVAGTLDLNTGIFTPSSNWLSGTHTWDGEFYVWVRFDADYNSMTINSWMANTAKVELVERKFAFAPANVPASWEE